MKTAKQFSSIYKFPAVNLATDHPAAAVESQVDLDLLEALARAHQHFAGGEGGVLARIGVGPAQFVPEVDAGSNFFATAFTADVDPVFTPAVALRGGGEQGGKFFEEAHD